ncbi:hypothetical protein MYX64_02890 [Nitrospinae bacterium AH_259_B05_G02_I21]|nr:hypothetical protein [Nitrospinae bacterium AH_259_B05_G02_I21]
MAVFPPFGKQRYKTLQGHGIVGGGLLANCVLSTHPFARAGEQDHRRFRTQGGRKLLHRFQVILARHPEVEEDYGGPFLLDHCERLTTVVHLDNMVALVSQGRAHQPADRGFIIHE